MFTKISKNKNYIVIFLFFNFVLFLLFNKFYKVIGIYDSPNSILKTHDKKMPVYGGIIFFKFYFILFLDLFYFNSFLKYLIELI